MIYEHPEQLKQRIIELTGRRVYGSVEVTEDTSAYMSLVGGMVLRLEGRDYYIISDAKEGRFGISEQPKFWVKYTVDLTDGARKILKLVFHEQFQAEVGGFTIQCVRSPDKESRVLETVDGDLRFMQGRTIYDTRNNNVRVIDWIRGKTLFNHVATIDQPPEVYYHQALPEILGRIAGCLDGLAYLQDNGLHHGDVRNDHIIVDSSTDEYRWIDFDLKVNYLDYDIWSVGNLLTYAVGKKIITCKGAAGMLVEGSIEADDALLFFPYRLANLRKVMPWISEDLTQLLLRFSAGTVDFYEGFAEIARDLRELLDRKLL